MSALPGRASLRQEDVWKRRYLVSGDGHLRTAGTGSRRPSRSIRSPPAGGALRGDDNQWRGCTEVPIPLGGEEPKRHQDGPGWKALLVAACGLARGWHSSRRWPSRPLGVEMVRVGGTAPLFSRHSVRWHLRMRLFLRERHGFRAHWPAGDRQPRSSRWVSRPSGAVAYPRRVPRRSRLVLAEWCCFRVFAQRARAHFGGVATGVSRTRHRITA